MRVAITGGLGFIGSHLADAFRANGYEVLVIDNLEGNVIEPDEHTIIMRDTLWSGTIRRRLPNLVVHAAAPVGPGLVASRGGRLALPIVEGAYAIGDACAGASVPLINISSSEVYGAPLLDSDPYEEDAVGHMGRFTPRSEYGLAKATAENVLANMPGLRHCSIRPFNTAGPRQSESKGFVLPTFIGQAKRAEPLTLYEPRAQRSLTSVYDFVHFITNYWEQALSLTEHAPYAINVANPGNRCSMLELAHHVASAHITATGSDCKIIETDPVDRWGDGYAFFGGKDGSKLPTAEIAYALGWRPVWGLHDIVDDAYERWTP